MVGDLVFTQKLEEKDNEKWTMGMHEGWLGKDPSTVLDGDFSSEDECVFLLEKRKAARRAIQGNGLGEIKAAGHEEEGKCQKSFRVLHLETCLLQSQDIRGQCCITLQI